jgi:AcrR family transcriptional regulator
MDDDVKPSSEMTPLRAKRRYNASRRRLAAEQTRRSIMEAARQMFLAHGYAGTTMPAIAEAAGVALDTVYATIGPKPILFRHLIELAISGEDKPVPAEEREYVRAILAERDPHRKIARYAHAVRMIQPRLAPLFQILREAARGDSELAALWTEIVERRAANMRLFVMDVAAAGGLRTGVTVDEAADLVWATNAPEFYLLLVDERGWNPERFEHWLTELWVRTLLP